MQSELVACIFGYSLSYHVLLHLIIQEQAQQHAITIIAMEEKLLSMMKTCKVLQEENQTVNAQLESKVTMSTAEIRS